MPSVTDLLGITAQGLETVMYQGRDKVLLKRLDEIIEQYEIVLSLAIFFSSFNPIYI